MKIKKQTVQVVIVDDSQMVRERVAALLSTIPGVVVAGQAGDVASGASLVWRLRPDVVVLDIDLAGQSGIELLEILKRPKETPLVIMLTGHDHPKLRQKCAELGANFYFDKTTELEGAIAVCQELAGRQFSGATPQLEQSPAREAARSYDHRAENLQWNRLAPFTGRSAGVGREWADVPTGPGAEMLDVLILHADEEEAERLRDQLSGAGIRCNARRVATESDFLAQLLEFVPDLILADHSSPGCDGMSALAAAQSHASGTPFIFVCDTPGEEIAIEALQHGATDYVMKQRLARLGPVVRRAMREVGERKRGQAARAALREAEEGCRALFDRSLDSLFVLDFEGGFLDANPAGLALLGYDRSDLGSLTVGAILSADQFPKASEKIREVMDLGTQPAKTEFTLRHKNGRPVVVETTASLILREGKPCAIFSISRDVTGRKQAEEALQTSDLRYRMIVKETGQMVYDYDSNSGVVQWEGALEEVAGYSHGEMREFCARQWEQHVHPDDRQRTLGVLDEAIRLGHRYHVEYRFRRKDGGYIFVEEHGSCVLDGQGRVSRMLGTISNVTARKNIEEQIREQARLLDLAHDAVLVVDLEDVILYWNESAQRLYGWTAQEAIGRKTLELLQRDPSRTDEIKEALLKQDDWNGEVTHFTKTGQAILIQTRLTLVRDGHGNPKSILAMSTNVTERKKFESQLLRAQRMESIGTLAGGIAHDLNNVLAPIMMACQLLESSAREADRKRLLEMIRLSAQRGADLVRQVLSFCRGAEGRRMELRVESLIQEIHHILRETFPKSIRFNTRVPQDLWSVVADATQLHQVLLNLCVNARDAMPNGGTLTLTVENQLLNGQFVPGATQAKPRPHLVITVSDTGTGIPLELQEKIFDPFFTTKGPGKGTGLGLSTSLAIVKNHGGFLNLSSEPGKGTVFRVHLPALTASNATIRQAREGSISKPQ